MSVFFKLEPTKIAEALESIGWSGSGGSAVIAYSAEAPLEPSNGNLWYDTTNTRLNLYSGGIWVTMSLTQAEYTDIMSTVSTLQESLESADASAVIATEQATLAEQYKDAILNMQVATGAAGSSVTWNGTTLTVPQGIQGIQGIKGDSVTGVSSSKVGKTTTVNVYVEGALENSFTVLDGADGEVSTAQLNTAIAGITKTSLGLANVDNTSDANKPVSTAQATAIALKADTGHSHADKQDTLVSGTNIKTINGTSVLGSGNMVLDTDSTLATLNKSFTTNEEVEIQLNKSVNIPIVSVTKEVPQVNITNSTWDVSGSNYEIDTELEYVGDKIQIKKDPTFNFANKVSFVPSSLSTSPNATIRCIGLSNGKFAVIHTNSANSPTLAIYNSDATVSLAQFVFPKTALLYNYAFSLIELSNGNIFCAFPNNSGYLSCTVVTQDGSQVGTLTITDSTYASISDYAISCCEFSNGNICIMFSGNKSGAGLYKHIVIVNNLCQIVYPTLQINTSYGYGHHISSCKVGADVFFAHSFDGFASKYVKLTKISATGAVTEVVSVNVNGSAATDSFGLKLIALDNGNMACLQRHTVSTPYNGSIDIFTPAGVKVNASTIVVVSLSGQTDNNIGDIYQVTNGFVWLGYSKVDGTNTLTAILYDNNGAFLSKHLLSTTATPYTVQYWNKRYLFFTAATTMFTGMFGNNIAYIKNKHLPSVSTQINTTFWSDINSMTANETLNGQTVNYALSADNRITWKVIKTGSGARNIVKNDSGTWKYNTATAEMTNELLTSGTASRATSSASYAGNEPYRAFDGIATSSSYYLGSYTSSMWLQYDNTTASKLIRYVMVCNALDTPNSWTLQGSNSGAFSGEQEIISTVTAQTGWVTATPRTFTVSTSNTYRYYRFVFTAYNQGSNYALGIYDISFVFSGYTTSETWTNATTNTEFKALSEAMSIPQNNMPSSQLQALTDSEQIVLGDELNLAQILYTNSASTTPIADGVVINYDANAKNVVATAGTDYTWSTTNGDAGDVITFKALANNNLKIRVV